MNKTQVSGNERAQAGWFPDPAGIHAERYWDGEHWTTQVVDRNGSTAATGTAFATRVLERACDIAGIDCKNNAMTADEALAALPATLAEASVRVMHRSYVNAGDTHHTRWAEAKLDEIRARPDSDVEVEPEVRIEEEVRHEPEPVASGTASVESGWYGDPGGHHQHRYWNGAAWTDRVANNGVQSDDPLRWEPPNLASSTPIAVAAEATAGHAREVQPISERIRTLRTVWVLSTIVFTVLTIGFLLLPVSESATSVDGTQTASLHCGSVLSPRATASGGVELANAASICTAARHSNTTRVYLFGSLAVLALALAAYARTGERRRAAASSGTGAVAATEWVSDGQ